MYKKGQSGNPKGRKKGQRIKATYDVKQSILNVYQSLGGDEGFSKWASQKGNKSEFYRIYSKLLPRDLKLDLPGELVIAWRRNAPEQVVDTNIMDVPLIEDKSEEDNKS